jgi:hypothetical protein
VEECSSSQKTENLTGGGRDHAEDTGSAAESANRALHHLRNLGTGVRAFECAFSMRTSSFVHGLMPRRAVFAFTVLAYFVPLTVLFKALGIISGTPFERRASRYAMWRQKGRLFDVLNSK